MKLKKLLAAVTAAALAVTTMAVTSFTAGAASLEEAPVGVETVLYSVDLTSVKHTFTSAWDNGEWTQVIIGEDDRATIMTDPEVYIKATMSNMGGVDTGEAPNITETDFNTLMTWGFSGYSWMTGLSWYNNDPDNSAINFNCNLIPTPDSTASHAIAYAPIADTKMTDWGGIAGNLQCGHFKGLTLDKLEIVRVSTVVDTTVYADQVLPLPEFEGSTLKFDGTFDKTKINGPGAYIEIKWTANDTSSGMKLMKAEDYDTVIGQKNGNGSVGAQTTTFKLDETFIGKMTDKMWVNGWGAASVESVTIHNDATKGDVYTPGGTSVEPTYTITPPTATIKVGESKVFTLEGYEGTEPLIWSIDTDFADMRLDSELTRHQVKIVGLAKSNGPLTLTIKKSESEILATATVTIVEDDTPPAEDTVTLAFPTDPIEIPVYASSDTILASVEVPFAIEGNKTFEDVKDTTYVINGINFTNVVKDGKELDLKNELMLFTHVGGELGDGVFTDSVITTMKKGDKNKSITIDMSSIVNAENKTQKLEKIVLILSFGSVKDSGLAVGDKIYLNGSTTTNPPVTTGALWEGTQDFGNWANTPVEIEAEKFTSVNANDTIKFTYSINAVPGEAWNQIKIADGNDTVLASPTGKNEWGCVDLSSATTYSFEISAADLALVKANGMKITGHGVVLAKVEKASGSGNPPVDPGHTHTPGNEWKNDAANHWKLCSECGEKVNEAAHTFNTGVITTPATETTTGVKTYTCTVCKYTKTETIPATGVTPSPAPSFPSHNYTGGVVVPIINNGSNSKTPSINGDNGKSGWDAIVSEIAASGDGAKVVVDMNGATKVPSSIMREIEGLDIDLVLNMGRGTKWTINGLSVTGHKNIDFGVSKNTRHISGEVVSTVDGTYKKQLSLDHNGTFGCTAALTVDVGTKYNGLYANLFYYNPKTKSLELTDCSLISGGNAKFMFTHASDYLITVTAEPLGEFEDVSSAAGIASDNNSIGNGIAVSAVLAAIVLGFGIVVYRKRRHN